MLTLFQYSPTMIASPSVAKPMGAALPDDASMATRSGRSDVFLHVLCITIAYKIWQLGAREAESAWESEDCFVAGSLAGVMAESALQMPGDQLTHQSWLAKGSSWQDSRPSGSPEDQGQASLLANTHLHTQQSRAFLSQSRCLMSLILMSFDSCIVQVEHCIATEQVHCSPLKLHDDHHDLVLQTLSATATKSNHVSIL